MSNLYESHETITGRRIDLSSLLPAEREMLAVLQREFAASPREDVFGMSWSRKVLPMLSTLSGKEATSHPLYVVAQDLGFRLGIAQGTVAAPDYRDYLFDWILEKFGSRYAFCKATGIPESFLSQVLSGEKDFSLATLARAAEALDLSLALLPIGDLTKVPGADGSPLAGACQAVRGELAVVKDAQTRLRRVRRPERRRELLAKESARFQGLLERLARPLKKLDDEAFGTRLLEVIAEERERLETLLAGLREQVARVARSGPLASAGRKKADRAPLSRR